MDSICTGVSREMGRGSQSVYKHHPIHSSLIRKFKIHTLDGLAGFSYFFGYSFTVHFNFIYLELILTRNNLITSN